ncbi:MAG: hypothetical protein J6X68_05100 [Lachnospiraceae bacterium]|nr:hypothetical protein [Lachnospiraceae bacterium]
MKDEKTGIFGKDVMVSQKGKKTMKTTDEQMNEIMRRSESLKAKKSMNDYLIGFSIAIAACLALIVLVGASIANVNPETTDNTVSQYGSLVISAPYMGYVVIGLLAFILGVLVTLLCRRIREFKQK